MELIGQQGFVGYLRLAGKQMRDSQVVEESAKTASVRQILGKG